MGNRDKRKAKITTRRTVQFPSNCSFDQQGSETHMFIEDLHLGIAPIYTHTGAYDVSIEPFNQEIENIIINAFPTEYRSRDLATTVFAFIQSTANMLSYSGHVYYEIIYEQDNLESKPDRFYLEDIPPNSIYRLINHYVQVVPKDVAEYSQSKRLIIIPARNIIDLSMPNELGGSRKYIKLLSQINRIRSLPPEFAVEEMARNTKKIGFDFSEWHNRIDIAKAKTTRKFGWNARSLWNDKCLEFYWFHRHLLFQRSQAILRNRIIQAMNETLKRAGQEMGFSTKLVITGLPEPSDIDKSITDLYSGELSFGDAAKVGSYL